METLQAMLLKPENTLLVCLLDDFFFKNLSFSAEDFI